MREKVLKKRWNVPFVSFEEQILKLKELERRWKEMSTKNTSKAEVAEVYDLYAGLYHGKSWYYGVYLTNDDLGQHIDLHVNVAEMVADGFAIPGAPLGVKTCIYNSPRNSTKPVVIP